MKTLFDRPLVRNKDPITSHQAADKMIETGTVEEQCRLMIDLLKRHKRREGWTWRELAQIAMRDAKYDKSEDNLAYTFHRRSSILENQGKIELVMRRECRISGYAASAWRAK